MQKAYTQIKVVMPQGKYTPLLTVKTALRKLLENSKSKILQIEVVIKQ